MSAHPDPWASTDHDPLSTAAVLHHQASITTGHALALARADIHDAVAADRERRRQYALSARDYAATVLLAPDATPSQRELAGYYLTDAEVFIANSP
jgi:hypothetical protein